MTRPFASHDLSSCGGRVLVAGDVHGRFGDLARSLERLRYDEARDRLVLLGDLINRGPDSHLAGDWIGNLRVLGNHEDALRDLGRTDLVNIPGRLAWMQAIGNVDDRIAWIRDLLEAPLMLQVRTPGGNEVGFVHGGVAFMDWEAAAAALGDPDHAQHHAVRGICLTDREHARGLREGRRGDVHGIGHVFLGHTPVPAPQRIRNTTLCDTSRSQEVQVIDVDDWIDISRRTA